MAQLPGLAKPRRIALLVPLVIVTAVVVVIAVFAWSHLIAKGPGPFVDQEVTAQGVEIQPQTRGPYGPADFTEPKSK